VQALNNTGEIWNAFRKQPMTLLNVASKQQAGALAKLYESDSRAGLSELFQCRGSFTQGV
jgi:hypothetical protein